MTLTIDTSAVDAEHVGELSQIDAARGVDADHDAAVVLDDVQHRMVLGGRADRDAADAG